MPRKGASGQSPVDQPYSPILGVLYLAVVIEWLEHYQSCCPLAEARRSRARRHGRRSAPGSTTPASGLDTAMIPVRLGR